MLSLASRRVLHIPIGFAPLPIVHNFEGASLKFACYLYSMLSTQNKIAP